MARVVPSRIVDVIETTFPWAALAADGKGKAPPLGPDQAPHVGMIISLIDQLPTELLPQDESEYTVLTGAVGAMHAALGNWQSGGHPGYNTALHASLAFGGDSPVTAVLKVLRKCCDEAPADHIAGLEFIVDHAARNSLRIDAGTAHRAFGNGEYKAATALAGSVVEALLMWSILQVGDDRLEEATESVKNTRRKDGERPPNKRGSEFWYLRDYVDIAVELKVIDEETRRAVVLTAEFRNLIHPGRVVRSGLDCSRSTALIALGSMERLIEYLQSSLV